MTVAIDNRALSVSPLSAGAVVSLKTVSINNRATLALSVASGDVAVVAMSDQPLLTIGDTSAVITAAAAGAAITQAVDGVSGIATVAVKTGQALLPDGSFNLAALKDGKVYAGETAQFDTSGKLTAVQLGSATGSGAGTPLKITYTDGVRGDAIVPDLQQGSARLAGELLVSGFSAAISKDLGIPFSTSSQDRAGILHLPFNEGSVTALPVGKVVIDSSRPDGMLVSGNKVEVTRGGIVATLVPGMADLAEFSRRLADTSANSNVSIGPDGTIRASLNGTSFIVQPDWVVTPVPADHASDPWWTGTDHKLYLRYSNGTAQGLTVR